MRYAELTELYYATSALPGRRNKRAAEKLLAEIQQRPVPASEARTLLYSQEETSQMAGCLALWKTHPTEVLPVLRALSEAGPLSRGTPGEPPLPPEEDQRRQAINLLRLDAEMMAMTILHNPRINGDSCDSHTTS